jgi:glucosamine--fructose-6-phosphate aminotransferase (isomerizing)
VTQTELKDADPVSMRSELGESPAIVEGLLGSTFAKVRALAREVAARDIDLVVIAARGTSDHAALYGQYILGARNRLLVAPAAPSLISLYGAAPRLRNALVIGISQSGKSPDVVAVIEESRRQGALTAAITNDPASELALSAEHVIELEAGTERAVAATKTYLAEIAVLAMLSAALSGDDDSVEQLQALPAALRSALATEADIANLAEARAGDDECAVLARGFHYATAREWALKLKELAYVLADPYSAADFQHGPIALVHPGMSILGVATTGPALSGMTEILNRVHEARARLLVLSDDADVCGIGDGVLLPRVPEWLSPLVAIIPAQLYAYHLARARGLDTEAPRNISKVTRTL